MTDVLLKMQLLMFQNKDSIDLGGELEQNTENLMRLICWEHRVGANSNPGDANKFEVKL